MNNRFGIVETQDGGAIVGEIRAGVFPIAPYGWLKCDGSAFDTNQYPKLAALLKDGKTPDLQGAVLSGRNSEALGSVIGSNTMTVPRHSHGVICGFNYSGSLTKISTDTSTTNEGIFSIPTTQALAKFSGGDGDWSKVTPAYMHDTVGKALGAGDVRASAKTIEEVGDASADVRGRRCIVNFIIRAI